MGSFSNTNAAATTSPHSSFSMPTTQQSEIPGNALTTSSISKAEILYPPDLIISTEFLPKIRNPPISSITAISPVLNQPSWVNDSMVASGFCQYSLKTVLPLIWISPGSSLDMISLFSSANRAETPGNGNPTCPATRFSS